ncbi:MAG TPA: hypothetical protein VFZ61_09395 [Polyangiales bacterium]
MGHRTQRALLGCVLLWTAACQLVMGSRGEGPQEISPSPVQGPTCGANQCSAGQVCCNASCGICAASGSLCIQIACEPGNDDLTCAELSCGARESCIETPAGAQCVPVSEDPCVRARCAADEKCQVVGGAAQCEPPPGSSDAGSERDAGGSRDGGSADASSSDAAASTDSSSSLDTGTPGSDTGTADTGTPQTDAALPVDTGVPDAAVLTCAKLKCPAGSYCDDSTGTPRCIKYPTCEGKVCPAGKHCELAEVVCVAEPCPKAPVCVDDDPPPDPCEDATCKPGQHCEVQFLCADGDKIVPPYPCEGKPACVNDGPGGSCGGKTCGPGTYCCNASCGICASKKGACLDVICEPPAI